MVRGSAMPVPYPLAGASGIMRQPSGVLASWRHPMERGHQIETRNTASERHEMEDFAVWALNRTLRGIFPLAAYQDMEFARPEIEEIRQLRRQRAAGGDETALRKFFRRDLHAGLVRNMRKVGVLTNRVAPDLEALGISL